MAVRVAWAGIDRDEVVRALREHGLEARIDERDDATAIEIPCDDADTERVCAAVLGRVEALIAELGLPLVPEQGDGQVFVRPPAA
jgi:hypothetical protein